MIQQAPAILPSIKNSSSPLPTAKQKPASNKAKNFITPKIPYGYSF
jgi:hypothetical protein